MGMQGTPKPFPKASYVLKSEEDSKKKWLIYEVSFPKF